MTVVSGSHYSWFPFQEENTQSYYEAQQLTNATFVTVKLDTLLHYFKHSKYCINVNVFFFVFKITYTLPTCTTYSSFMFLTVTLFSNSLLYSVKIE